MQHLDPHQDYLIELFCPVILICCLLTACSSVLLQHMKQQEEEFKKLKESVHTLLNTCESSQEQQNTGDDV